MEQYEKELTSGLIISDHGIKIGDIGKSTLDAGLLKKIESNISAMYIDQHDLHEHLYDVEDFAKLEPLVDSQERAQLNEIFSFIKSRQLAYIRLV